MKTNPWSRRNVSGTVLVSVVIATAASAFELACHREPYQVPRWYESTSGCPTGCTIQIQSPPDITCIASTVSYSFCNNYDQYGKRCKDFALLYTYLGVCQSTELGYTCINPSGEPIGLPTPTRSYIPCYQGYDSEQCP